jgi:hypothetical protein
MTRATGDAVYDPSPKSRTATAKSSASVRAPRPASSEAHDHRARLGQRRLQIHGHARIVFDGEHPTPLN